MNEQLKSQIEQWAKDYPDAVRDITDIFLNGEDASDWTDSDPLEDFYDITAELDDEQVQEACYLALELIK